MSNEKKMTTGTFPAAGLQLTGPTQVELLLEQMATAFPENDLPEVSGEVIEARYEWPVCPFCGQRHPQVAVTVILFPYFGSDQ